MWFFELYPPCSLRQGLSLPETPDEERVANQGASGVYLSPHLPGAEMPGRPPHALPAFCVGSGDEHRVLMLAWLAFYYLNCLPRPVSHFSKEETSSQQLKQANALSRYKMLS